MHHDTPLISTLVMGLVVAFALGALAQRIRISPLVGYLLAGILIGPFTPGYVADQKIADQLAEIGVILLMFGVGLHFSLDDLLKVKAIAIPGAIAQIAVATLLGMGLSHMLGWPLAAGLVFGLALSVASTVVLLRALQERRLVETERGRIAVGWLIVEDIAMVLALVLLPVLADTLKSGAGQSLGLMELRWPLALTLAKVAGFVVIMLIVGRRVIPWILHWVAHTGSRELFRLAVLAIALGVAFGAAMLFDVSFALGAFFAGMILARIRTVPARRAGDAAAARRLRGAVLRVGRHAGRSDDRVARAAAGAGDGADHRARQVDRGLCHRAAVPHPPSTALTISASLAQIGEFSFILVGLGVSLTLLPAARPRPRPGRRDPVDPAQSGVLRLAGPLSREARSRSRRRRTRSPQARRRASRSRKPR